MTVLVTPPVNAVVTTATAKAHLNVEHSDADTLIDDKVAAATEYAQAYLGQQLITATRRMDLDKLPTGNNPLYIDMPPLQSVEFIKYYDNDGVLQTWDSDNYSVDTSRLPARITPVYGVSWPVPRDVPNAAQVQFDCGYGDDPDDVPDNILAAILMLVHDYYASRSSLGTGSDAAHALLNASHHGRL